MGKRVDSIKIKYKTLPFDYEYLQLWLKNLNKYSFTICSIYLNTIINQLINV